MTADGPIPPPWNHYATEDERQKLLELAAAKVEFEEILAERRAIMRRCIRRMRRKEGKE